jgi:hypothetical protein
MAKKSKKFSTDLDETIVEDPELDSTPDEIVEEDDSVTYTMGDIATLENDEEEKVSLKEIQPSDEEEWVLGGDEEYSTEDYDPYLDAADYDGDNPYDDDY